MGMALFALWSLNALYDENVMIKSRSKRSILVLACSVNLSEAMAGENGRDKHTDVARLSRRGLVGQYRLPQYIRTKTKPNLQAIPR